MVIDRYKEGSWQLVALGGEEVGCVVALSTRHGLTPI